QISGVDVVPVRGPQERRGPVLSSDVGVNLEIEQGANSGSVLRPGRLHEAEAACRICGPRLLRGESRDGEHQTTGTDDRFPHATLPRKSTRERTRKASP